MQTPKVTSEQLLQAAKTLRTPFTAKELRLALHREFGVFVTTYTLRTLYIQRCVDAKQIELCGLALDTHHSVVFRVVDPVERERVVTRLQLAEDMAARLGGKADGQRIYFDLEAAQILAARLHVWPDPQ